MAKDKGHVFISGGNGFIASQIISQLVEEGFQTVASVRSDAKGQEMLDVHPDWKGKVSFVTVPDLVADKAFNHVFEKAERGFNYIIHAASPVDFSVTDFQKELIDPAVKGTLDLITTAHQLGGSQLKRFVQLGSAVAVLDSFNDIRTGGADYTEKDWNSITAAQAIESKNSVLGYNASKKFAEEAAWQFLSKNKTSFDLTVINPVVVIGPMAHPIHGPKNINETNGFAVWGFLNGSHKDIESVCFPFYHAVDVRDVARAHVLSLTTPAASNQRILTVSGLITPQLVVNLIRKNFPQLKDRVLEGTPDRIMPEGVDPRGWNVSKSHEIFGPAWKFRDVEESIVDTVSNILELEKGWAQ